MSWDNIRRRKEVCDNCRQTQRTSKLGLDEVKERCTQKGFELLDNNYNGNDSTLTMRCKNCSKIVYKTLKNLTLSSHNYCEECNGIRNKKYTIEEIKEYCEQKELELLSTEYNRASDKLKVKCKCGKIFECQWAHILYNNKTLCNDCSNKKSFGERAVEHVLDKNGLSFKEQYVLENCKNVRPLPFDFAIFNSSQELILLIEFDGEQHYRPVDFGMRDEDKIKKDFERRVVNDDIKTNYCELSNIPLLRIPYWEKDNIEKIILNKLNRLYGNTEVSE